MASNGDFRRMVCLSEASALIDRMSEDFYGMLPAEEVAIEDSAGRKLAADAIARINAPSYDLCTMDGYAVHASDGYPLRIVGEAFAGKGFRRIGAGEAVYVTTGACLPDGADAVLPVEDARVTGDSLEGASIRPGTNVVLAGSDLKAGDVLLCRGSIIAPATAGAFHAAGIEKACVYRKPRVAVLATGDEIRDGTVADANGPMVCAMLEAWGCMPDRVVPVGDDREQLLAAVDAAMADHDFVITIGGVSMGKMDLVSSIAEDGEIIFKGIRVKPGKPFIASYYRGKPLFSLPGKPSGSYTAMELLVRRFVIGQSKAAAINMPVSRDVVPKSPGFDHVVYVELRGGEARPVGYEGSSVNLLSGPEYDTSLLSTTARTVLADGYFIAHDTVKAGQPVTVNLSR